MRAHYRTLALATIFAVGFALVACGDDSGSPDARITLDGRVVDAALAADAGPTIDGRVTNDGPVQSVDGPTAVPDAGADAAIGADAGTGADAATGADAGPVANTLPDFIMTTPTVVTHTGDSDDLLTAGLGKTGLAGAAPTISTPPTAAELRRLAIYTNYRALVDFTANGGYGKFWGPNVDLDGGDTLGEGLIPGTEVLAFADDGTGKQNVSLLVQIPDSFDQANPCIVTAPSSGSRGVYGAISAAGEWGLKRGCAVAYTDKGTGNGAHELMTDTVTLIDGTTTNSTAAGQDSVFTADVSADDRAAYNAANPWRYAFKHAHSRQNPEKDWGNNVIQAVQFAYWALNDKFGTAIEGGGKAVKYAKGDIVTISASVSNGGGASLAAGELDDGWITAVVVGEPQINLSVPQALDVEQGNTTVAAFGHPLYDYTTTANLFQPCAAYADSPLAVTAPSRASISMALATNRCAALKAGGLISGDDFQSQANDALAKLHAAGYLPQSDALHASMWVFAVPPVAVTYADAYALADVTDDLCDFTFGTVNSTTGLAGVAPAVSPMKNIFGVGNGIPPTNGIQLVYNAGILGPAIHTISTPDAAYVGAKCLRDLWTGATGTAAVVHASVNAVRHTGNLHGKPAIIVQGRSDTLVPINHSSRPYYGMNKIAEGDGSNLVFYEIENGQHFDGFIDVLPGFDTQFVPVHYYNVQAMNLMWDHLMNGTALPPSQVVRTTPRGGTAGAAPALTTDNIPPIKAAPGVDAITFAGSTVTIPE